MSVLIYTENWDGKFKKLSNELVSYGSKIAEMLGTESVVLSIGEVNQDELKTLGNYGAQKILNLKNDALRIFDSATFSSAIAKVAENIQASVIIVANNNAGKAIAPRLSVKLKAAVGACVSKLPVDIEPFTIYKKVYSGNAYANVVLKTDTKILTLAQNSFDLVETDNKAVIEDIGFDIDSGQVTTEVKEVDKQTGKLLLTDAEIVVSGGRGMKSPDNWGPIEELANLLNAATACSRPVSDEGWRPHSEHTGQTGKIIAPNLYFAIGISGAIQHLAGISSTKCIVAINSDKDAPIFEAANYGIVGDAHKVLPRLIEAVQELKQ